MEDKIVCKGCEEKFIPTSKNKRFCSTPCYRKWYSSENKVNLKKLRKIYESKKKDKLKKYAAERYAKTIGKANKKYRETFKKCVGCKTKFNPRQKNSNYCSNSCYHKNYYNDNLEKLRNNSKEWWQNNREENLIKKKKYNKENSLRNRISIGICENKNKDHYKKKKAEWTKNKLETDPQYKLCRKYRAIVAYPIRHKRMSPASKKLLGCDYPSYVSHLESKFQKGMTWDNYGDWEIDHLIPIKEFNLINISEAQRCFNYKNTQPLWKYQNALKESFSRKIKGGGE